jgi:hypothetical protein
VHASLPPLAYEARSAGQAGIGSGHLQLVISGLDARFGDARKAVEEQAEPEQRDEALAHADELERAVVNDRRGPGRIQNVLRWFENHAPQLVGTVVSVVINPLVGKVVEGPARLLPTPRALTRRGLRPDAGLHSTPVARRMDGRMRVLDVSPRTRWTRIRVARAVFGHPGASCLCPAGNTGLDFPPRPSVFGVGCVGYARGVPRHTGGGQVYELIPLLAGSAAGLRTRSWPLQPAAAAIAVVGLVAGTVAATVSGELALSATFLLWDIGQGVVAGLAVRAVGRRLAAARAHEG